MIRFRRHVVHFSFVFLVAACASAAATTPPQGVETRTFFSDALQRSMPYQVVLPAGYASTKQHYPVLYLLHGWHGDETNYTTLTQLVRVASAYPVIIVLPRGNDSWYVNSATVPADRYADYIFTDVVAEIDKHFRTIPSREGRAIAGLSMGGYGAMLTSLRHPGAFAFVGSLSGALAGPTGIEAVMPVLKPSTDAAFGAAGSDARKDSDLDLLLSAGDTAGQPYMFLSCGSSDPLLASNRRVVAELSLHKFAYEYHELPGAHTWTFWNSQLQPMLTALTRAMHLAHGLAMPKPAPAMPQSEP